MPAVGRVGDSTSPEEWFYSMPPITRYMFSSVLLITCGVSFGFISPGKLNLFWPSIVHKFEIWRLFTSVLFFGKFSFPFLIHLYMLYQHSMRYELSPYNTGGGGSSADYAWMLIICMGLLAAAGYFFGIQFLGNSLVFMIMYVWSRKNPREQARVFTFSVQSQYLPWAMLALNLLIGNDWFLPLIGIGVAHVYYFLHEVAPAAYGVRIIQTPSILIEYFGGAAMPPAPAARQERDSRQDRPAARPYAGHQWGRGNVLGED